MPDQSSGYGIGTVFDLLSRPHPGIFVRRLLFLRACRARWQFVEYTAVILRVDSAPIPRQPFLPFLSPAPGPTLDPAFNEALRPAFRLVLLDDRKDVPVHHRLIH